MKRSLVATFALVGLGLLILHQLGRLEELASRQAQLRREIALEKLGPLPEQVPGATVNPVQPARTARLEEIIRRAPKVMGGVPLPFPEQLFTDFPQLEANFLKAKQADLRLEYGGFFTLARFSPEQIERYLEISLSGERDWIAQSKAAAARGVTLSDPAIKLMGQEGAARRKRELEELLGPAGLALREQYREERPARTALQVMAKATVLNDHALSVDQLNRLAALTTELGVFDNDRPWRAVDLFSGSSGLATEILSPEQQELFELLIDARQAAFLKALDRRRSR
jgi:hypothetical protein